MLKCIFQLFGQLKRFAIRHQCEMGMMREVESTGRFHSQPTIVLGIYLPNYSEVLKHVLKKRRGRNI